MRSYAGDGEREHRRGFVMGLTMAEAMLLLVFVLLLALAALAGEMERKAAAAEERVGTLSQELTDWRRIEGLLKSARDGERATGDESIAGGGGASLLQRLTEAEAERQALAAAEHRIAHLQAELVEARRKAAERDEASSLVDAAARVDPAARPVASLKKGLETLEAMTTPGKVETRIEAEPDRREEFQRLAEVNRRLADHNRLLALENESMRKGGATFPSCWIADDGESDFLFDLTITDGGILVRDLAPAARSGDPIHDLIEPFERGVRMPAARFQTVTARLFHWSQEKRCRFYVELRDATGPTSKANYQRMRRVIEGHFYIRHRW